MPENPVSERRHAIMAAIPSTSTVPEVTLRRALWKRGFRYRVNDRRLPGSPDIVLPRYRTAIFVNGCFWHGHKGCPAYTVPKTNTEFWTAKVARNRERDQDVWRRLEAKGWRVIVVWECQTGKSAIDGTAEDVAERIRANGEAYLQERESRRKARAEYLCERRRRKEREKRLKEEIPLLCPRPFGEHT